MITNYIIILSSIYIGEWSFLIRIILFFAFVISIFRANNSLKTNLFGSLFFFLGTSNYLFYCISGEILNKDKKKVIYKVAVLTPLIRFTIENFSFLGLKYYFIYTYAFGIPLIFISTIIAISTLKRYKIFIIVVISLIANTYYNYQINKNGISIHNKYNSKILPSYFINHIVKKVTVNNHSTRKLNIICSAEKKFAYALKDKGSYLILGEHDNLNGCAKRFPDFHHDSYRRKGFWKTSKPIMTLRMKYLSNLDPLYCSNIGCTLTKEGSPIVWDYNKLGSPIILAKKNNSKANVTYFGDSDPFVKNLLPYNLFFIKGIFGYNSARYLFICSLIIFLLIYKKKFIYVLILLALLVPEKITYYGDENIIDITNLKPIHSPHYDWDKSSFPAKISDLDIFPNIYNKSKAKTQVCIGECKELDKDYNIIFLKPGDDLLKEFYPININGTKINIKYSSNVKITGYSCIKIWSDYPQYNLDLMKYFTTK